jgi:outer membrane immunogenic protein
VTFKVLSISASIVAISIAAHAADLPSKRMPPALVPVAPPAFSWNGIYGGLNIGYGFGTDPVSSNIASTGAFFTNFSNHLKGVIGGGQVGINYVVYPQILIGAETDFAGTGMTGDTFVTRGPGTSELRTSISYIGTVRGRVGYVLPNNWLIYGTGGFAYLRANASNIQASSNVIGGAPVGATFNFGQNRNGYAVGGGMEFPIIQNLTVKVEYMYEDFGTYNQSLVPTFNRTSSDRLSIQTAKVGVNYKFDFFNPTAPVVARY